MLDLAKNPIENEVVHTFIFKRVELGLVAVTVNKFAIGSIEWHEDMSDPTSDKFDEVKETFATELSKLLFTGAERFQLKHIHEDIPSGILVRGPIFTSFLLRVSPNSSISRMFAGHFRRSGGH